MTATMASTELLGVTGIELAFWANHQRPQKSVSTMIKLNVCPLGD